MHTIKHNVKEYFNQEDTYINPELDNIIINYNDLVDMYTCEVKIYIAENELKKMNDYLIEKIIEWLFCMDVITIKEG